MFFKKQKEKILQKKLLTKLKKVAKLKITNYSKFKDLFCVSL